MGLFDSIFNKKASALKKVRIDRATINGKSIMTFYFKKTTIKLESMKVNPKEEVILLESFYPMSGKYGYGVEDFVEDIIRLEKFIENNPGENALYEALDMFSSIHIKEFKRLVDADLYRNIAIFILYISAFSAMNGEPMDNDEKKSMSETFAYREFNSFSNYLFITKYKFENGQTIPYLEKYVKRS